jgi:hypothetical protein
MRRFRLTKSLGRVASRLTVVMGLVGFLVVNSGLPVVQPVNAPSGKDKSKPFPCQSRACGCMSQDQCMRGCCCFTASERLAWANEHDVKAPAELVAEAEHEHERGDDPQLAKSCCATGAAIEPTAACANCDDAHDDANHEHANEEEGSQGWHVTFIMGALASHCRGLGPLSALAFSALPPAAAVSYHYDWCPSGWITIVSPRASSTFLQPLLRPPCA